MPIETRVTADGYLDIKSPELNAWVRLFAPTKVAGGQDIKIAGEQGIKFSQMAANVAKLKDLVDHVSDSKAKIEKIQLEFADLISEIRSTGITIENVGSNILNIQSSVTGLVTAVSENTIAIENTSQNLNSILTTLRDIQSSLDALSLIRDGIDELRPPTSVFERVAQLTAQREMPVPLPDHTKIFAFAARKDTLGRFHDIQWSLKEGNIAAGVSRTLWAGGEEYQDGLDLSGKVLYLWCKEAITVEIIGYSS